MEPNPPGGAQQPEAKQIRRAERSGGLGVLGCCTDYPPSGSEFGMHSLNGSRKAN